MNAAAQLLMPQGRVVEVAGNKPFLLDRRDDFWLVLEGQVELFAVAAALESYGRSRIHLGTAFPGQALFGLGEKTQRLPFGPRERPSESGAAAPVRGPKPALLAVALPGTRVLALKVASLQEIVRTSADPQLFAPLIDDWLRCLFTTSRPAAPPKNFAVLVRGKELELEDGGVARSAGGVVWVRQVAGRALFLGREDLPFEGGGLLPITDDTWLVGRQEHEQSWRASVVDSPLLLRAGTIWDGLDRFHHLLLLYVQALVREAGEREREQLGRRRQRDRQTLEAAYRGLAGAVDAGVAEAPELAAEPLLAACQLVGRELGLTFRRPAQSGERTSLEALCAASHVRQRRVLLRDDWWRRPRGPLLGRLQGEPGQAARPVALLTRAAGYELWDPLTGLRRPVDSELAAKLAPHAAMFYRALPDGRLGPLPLLRLAFAGSRSDLLRLVAAGLAGGALALVGPWLTGYLIGRVLPAADRGQLWQLAAALVLAALAGAAFALVRGLSALRVTGQADFQLQAALWDRLLALPSAFFRRYPVGDLADRVLGVDAMRELFSGDIANALLGAAFSLVSFALLWYYSPSLALVAAGLIALLLALGLALLAAQLPHQNRQSATRGRLAALLFGLLNGIGKLRVAGAEQRAFARWAGLFAELRRAVIAGQRLTSALQTLHLLFPLVASMALFAMVAWAPAGEALPLHDFLGFNAAFVQMLAAMQALLIGMARTTGAWPIYKRLEPILETLPERRLAQLDPGELRGDLEFSHVSFRYQADGPPILDDVSFTARAGELIALVGPSGAGKSTCLRLMLGFEQPTAGSIYFDGQDLPSLDVTSLRRQIGVVLQNGRPIVGDLFTNIVGDNSALTQDDAWAALRLAGLEDEVRALPMGLFTPISEGGATFSGGQRQRLLIARAVASRPRLLIFDEATSALDNRAQAAIRESLAQLKATRIVVAHRLSTVIDADRIVVLDAGRVVESGTYAELMARGGLFHRLAARQRLVP